MYNQALATRTKLRPEEQAEFKPPPEARVTWIPQTFMTSTESQATLNASSQPQTMEKSTRIE